MDYPDAGNSEHLANCATSHCDRFSWSGCQQDAHFMFLWARQESHIWHWDREKNQSKTKTSTSVYWQVLVVAAHSHNESQNLIIPNCTRRSDCTNIIRRLLVDVGGAAACSARPCRDVEVMQTPAGKHYSPYFICCCFQSASSHWVKSVQLLGRKLFVLSNKYSFFSACNQDEAMKPLNCALIGCNQS